MSCNMKKQELWLDSIYHNLNLKNIYSGPHLDNNAFTLPTKFVFVEIFLPFYNLLKRDEFDKVNKWALASR